MSDNAVVAYEDAARDDSKIWMTQDGREIPISEMGTDHIKACIGMLERKGYIGMSKLILYMSVDTTEMPDGAAMAVESEQNAAFSAPVSVHLDELRAELRRRA